MPVSFNTDALDTYRNAQFKSANSIANLAGKDGLSSDTTYKGGLVGMFRGHATKVANNAVRSDFLITLGRAFDIKGVSFDKDNSPIFSNEFMDRLEEILGDAFKREDFGVAAGGGKVTGGKPLTSRRITAIVKQAAIVGKGKFNAKDYKAKLDSLQGDIDALDTKNNGYNDKFVKHIDYVRKCLDFLDKDFENLIQPNPEHLGFDDDEEAPAFMIVDPKSGKNIPLKSKSTLSTYLGSTESIGGVFHLSLYKEVPDAIRNEDDLKKLKDNVRGSITAFVQNVIDACMAAKANGKFKEVVRAFADDPGACIDGKGSRAVDVIVALGLSESVSADRIEAADHDANTKLDKCIYEEINMQVKKNPNAASWEDLAEGVKLALVGVTRPIMTVQDGKIVPLEEDGKQVVRPITVADIDRLGPVCTDILAIF